MWRINNYRSFGIVLLFPAMVMAQDCNTAIMPTTPSSQFTNYDDGTVTDKKTGLMWMKCTDGQSGTDCGTGTAVRYTWQLALQVPQSVNTNGGFAGYTDWRLPNINELSTIVEKQCIAPTINEEVFPATPVDYFWSSSPSVSYPSNSWNVQFWLGYSGHTSRLNNVYVRLVRTVE